MRFLLDFYAISRGSMIFLRDCYGICMVLPWGSFDNLMGLLWHPSGISMMLFLMFLWDYFGIALGCT